MDPKLLLLSNTTSAFEALPFEIQLLIAERLGHKSLRRLQRVSRRMKKLVAHPALDRTMFRSAFDEETLRAAPTLELHPLLKALPNYAFTLGRPAGKIHRHFSKAALEENATVPPCAVLYFDCFDDHECEGPQIHSWTSPQLAQFSKYVDPRALKVGASEPKVPEWDTCIKEHKVTAQGNAVSVREFLDNLNISCRYACDLYDGVAGDKVGNPRIFDGWLRQRIDRESCSAWFQWPRWIPVPHELDGCGAATNCSDCQELRHKAYRRKQLYGSEAEEEEENPAEDSDW